MTKASFALASFLCVSFVAPQVHADAAAEARFHDELARRHYSAHHYEDAVREFMLEQRLAPNPNIVFNIALCFRRLNRHADAYMYYAEYLASGDPHEQRRRDSEAALTELRPRVALVSVESNPVGAAIYVDRRELGQYGVTPRVLALSPGDHRIWIEKDGYREAEQTLDLDLGGEASVSLTAEQILGRFRLTASAEAHVRLLDAEGTVVFEGEAPVDEQIPPGTYQVEATAGDERWSEPIRVRAEGVTEATAALVGPTGVATVTANVIGALVTLDGRERGFTPQVLTRIPVGEHELTVASEGMRTYEGALDVVEDDHSWLTVDLRSSGSGISMPTWVMGGITVAFALGAGVMTGLSVNTRSQYDALDRNVPRRGLLEDLDNFSRGADLLWLGAAVSAITTVILLFADSDLGDSPSTATVTRRQP